MPNDLQILMQKMSRLEAGVERLESEKSALEFDNLPADAMVGKEYAAWRLGLSIRAVTQGENGTKALRFSRPGEKHLCSIIRIFGTN